MDIRTITVTVAIVALIAFRAAVAADNPAGSPKGAEALEEIIVTGTSIPTTPDEVAVPVVTLNASDLAQIGISSNALEMLRTAVPSFAGRSNTGTSNANNNNQSTAGGSQLQLRNLPTLVLVNGRRLANSGIGALQGKNFVDVNQIPPEAVDHIDVLTDGASSIYGSDAIGGVVNFVLKSDYEGLTAGARGATAENYGERSAFVTGGVKLGSVSITATANISHTDPLYQNERSFSSPLYGTTSAIPGVVNGGNDILSSALGSPSAKNPTGVNATAGTIGALESNGTYQPTTPTAIRNGFDVSPYQTLLLKQNVASFVANLNAPLIDNGKLEAFGDVMVSQGRSATQWKPVNIGFTAPAGAPYNPLTTSFSGTFDDLALPQGIYNKVVSTRLTAGLRGEISRDWDWETAVVYSESDLEQRQTNLPFVPNIANAIAGGYNAAGVAVAGGGFSQVLNGFSLTGPLVLQPALDPFATRNLSPSSLAHLYGTEVLNAVSQLTSWDGKVVGRLFALPAGDVGIAFGASVRRESESGHTDANGRNTDPVTGSQSGNAELWQNGTFADPFAKGRTISGVFTEVRVPIASPSWNIPGFHAFDLTGAVRGEKYSDAGNSTVPKFGFRWQPIDSQLTLRGNYAKSFVAPGLFDEYGPTDTRLAGPGVIKGVFGPNYSGMPINAEDGNNPNLKPATSVSKTIGLVLKPEFIKDFAITADFSDITLTGFAGGLGFNNVLRSINTLGAASPYFNNLAVDGFYGSPKATQPFTHPGDLQAFLTNAAGVGDPNQAIRLYAIDRYTNLASLIEQSWNIGANYGIPTDRAGTITLATNGALFNSFKFQGLPGQNYIQYAGHSTSAGVFGGTLPKYRFYSTFNWVYNDLRFTVANTYVASTTDTGANGDQTPIPVSGYSSWDARLGYDWHSTTVKDVKLAVGATNLTNRMPPLAPRAFTDNNADVSTFSPIGRMFYCTVSVAL
jgi:iron complex outermembrane receptor protein